MNFLPPIDFAQQPDAPAILPVFNFDAPPSPSAVRTAFDNLALYHLDNHTPERLSKRARPALQLEPLDAFRAERLTPEIECFLLRQDPPWAPDDLHQLSLITGACFIVELCEQVACRRDREVFRTIPTYMVNIAKRDLKERIHEFKTLIEYIENPEEQASDQTNSDPIPFYDTASRNANRAAYLMGLHVGVCSNEMASWLGTRGWDEEELENLCTLETIDDLVAELVTDALEKEDYEVIQSIPQELSHIALDQIKFAIDYRQDLLNFIRY